MTDIKLEIPNVLDSTTLLWFKNLNYKTKIDLLTSLLKKNIDVLNITIIDNINFNKDPEYKYKPKFININNLLFLCIRERESYFRIYPYNTNIIHLIINHNLPFIDVFNFCIFMYYWNYGGYNSIDFDNFDMNSYINEIIYTMCDKITSDNIIFKYDYNYKQLLCDNKKSLMTNNDKSISDLEIKYNDILNKYDELNNKYISLKYNMIEIIILIYIFFIMHYY